MARSPFVALALSIAVSAATPAVAAPVAPLDQEFWAGISYRDAIVGAVVLGSGAAVVSLLTGSTATAVATVVAVAVAYVVYDPGVSGVVTPSDTPTLPELRRRGGKNQTGD
jgi:hypothetical protein